MANKDLTSKNGMLWVQPLGPNTMCYPLLCTGSEDLVEPKQSKELQRCWNTDGNGWDVTGSRISPAGPVTLTLTTRQQKGIHKIEDLPFPSSVYLMARDSGAADVITNYVKGYVVTECEAAEITRSGLKSIEEDVEGLISVSFEGNPPLLVLSELVVDRLVSACTDDYNAICVNLDSHPYDDSGDTLLPGDAGIVVGDSAVAPALANIEFTDDAGDTWTAAAADPFAAGSGAMAVTSFYVGRNTRRYLVGMEAPAAAQGMVAYTDDDGATWTTVNIGGAAAGDGAAYGGGLWAIDSRHIWLAGANGYIYFSEDGGETWTNVEAGVITAGDYNCVHFSDKTYGVAGAPGDIIAISDDGGQTWEAVTATGGGGDILCCARLDKNRLWVGTDDGTLWYSRDAGTTWTQRTGWEGSGTGGIRAMSWYGDHVCFMAHDSAAPVGTVLYTFNGGQDWAALDTATNAGLNDIRAVNERTAFACGKVEGGLSVILKVRA